MATETARQILISVPREVVKRDGSCAVFDADKIRSAIQRAGQATGEFGAAEANQLAAQVSKVLIHRHRAEAPHVASRDPQAAVKLYDDIAADRSIGAAEQELAKVRAAGLLLDTSTYPAMLTRLEAAAAPGATFRHTARELLALAAWRANDTTAARRWLDLIANDGETPQGLRSRAEALQALLPPVAKS